MKILVSEYNGFCGGVKAAVLKADKVLAEDKKLYSYGEIIHNKDVVDRLKEKGMVVVDDLPEKNDAKVLIRSHGAGKNFYEALEEKNIEVIDATCVKVKKIHKIVEEFKNNDYNIIIVGDESHPEVQGIAGWCRNEADIIKSPEDLEKIIEPDKKYCLVCQTTFNLNTFEEILRTIASTDTISSPLTTTVTVISPPYPWAVPVNVLSSPSNVSLSAFAPVLLPSIGSSIPSLVSSSFKFPSSGAHADNKSINAHNINKNFFIAASMMNYFY
jgi:(E)-4-hydroxy-3-methyl-but-2-enyl pyrophosphate reductase